MSISDYIEKYGPDGVVAPGTKKEGTQVSLAGRLHNIRESGAKLKFYDLHGEGMKVQIMATQQSVGSVLFSPPPPLTFFSIEMPTTLKSL